MEMSREVKRWKIRERDRERGERGKTSRREERVKRCTER